MRQRILSRSSRSRRAGFTLLEILITVGILVVLTALAIPAILLAKKKGIETRTRSDLALIENALEAYKVDFQGVYPQFVDVDADANDSRTVGGGWNWLDNTPDRGARLLCRALLGPGAAASDSTNPTIAQPGDDGADGPGFRVRRVLVGTTALGGRVYGPYIQSEKFKLEYDTKGLTNKNMSDAKLLDQNGNPILYFPANPGAKNLAVGYVGYYVPPSKPYAPVVYNSFDNNQDTTPQIPPLTIQKPLLQSQDMQYILGDRNTSTTIDTGETPVTTQPYLLWTAGADGIYGFGSDTNGNPLVKYPVTGAVGIKIDDITNFDIPADLRK